MLIQPAYTVPRTSNRKVSSLQINLTSSNIQGKRFRGKSRRLKTQTSYQPAKRVENNAFSFNFEEHSKIYERLKKWVRKLNFLSKPNLICHFVVRLCTSN